MAITDRDQTGTIERATPDVMADRLRRERAAQVALVGEGEDTARALTGQHDVDSILERELAVDAAQRARDAVVAIDEALDRIAAGTYGRCEVCHDAIPMARLEVLPFTRTCVSCTDR